MNKHFLLFLALLAAMFPLCACSAQERAGNFGNRPNTEMTNADTAVKIGQVVRDCPDCPEMVAVPQVGHDAGNPGKIFYAGRFEVTWREYLIAVREKACPVPAMSFGGFYDPNDPRINDNYPLTGIGPNVFPCYLEWLKKKTGNTYRIPSAVEWEHVARAGTHTEYYWGDGLGYNNAIVPDYFDMSALKRRLGYPQDQYDPYRHDPRGDVEFFDVFPVGQFPPNPWGLYDTIGNAGEMTTEAYAPQPRCLQRLPATVCGGRSVRGSDIFRRPRPRDPNPPITESLVTARFRAVAQGGAYVVGYRLVRD